MKFVADLHIHSHYSRATSKNLNFEQLSKWAQLKGVQVVGTGDIAHPGWLQEMHEHLEPAEDGLFRLKAELSRAVQAQVPPACRNPVRFLLAGEISSIYKKNERVRKIHNVIFAPSLAAVAQIQTELEKIGNIRSDGRPILGLDSRDLLEIILEIDPQNYLIPAHIWTPWFSLLGSKSGFDSVAECFDDLTPHIFAVETGLSSDPPMNWRISMLDKYTLVSNSDAHSPQKLAREANLFNTELSYTALFAALKSGNPQEFLGTLEFFPEEGKYHGDGHRKCGVRWEPPTTLAHHGICPVCGKKVTVGVLHRVESLADRPAGSKPARTHPFRSIIPLPEILSEVHQVGPTSKKVRRNFEALLEKLGPELEILLDVPLEAIAQAGGPLLAEGIRRMRHGKINIAAGFDGEFGRLKLFTPDERDLFAGQTSFLPPAPKARRAKNAVPNPKPAAPPEVPTKSAPAATAEPPPADTGGLLATLNPQQRTAAACTGASLIITAGPGTGKTRTLTHRMAYLITEQGVPPESLLAITFTHKAAAEMAERLAALVGSELAGRITLKTFHAFGALLLRQYASVAGLPADFALCTDDDRAGLLKQAAPELDDRQISAALDRISAAKNHLLTPQSAALDTQVGGGPEFAPIFERYEQRLAEFGVLDFDDLILRAVRLLENHAEIRAQVQRQFRWISVDEYQDVNRAQVRLLQLLAGPNTNLCAIGDPDQAIYGFRGADRRYFLQFQQDFPAAKSVRLSQNYRSTQRILDAAEQVIRRGEDTAPRGLWSNLSDPARLAVLRTATGAAEAETVVHEIERRVGGTSYFSLDSGRVDDDGPTGRAFGDFAVLYRLNAQAQPLMEAFDRSGIPYQTIGRRPLAAHRDVKTVLAHLWLAASPDSLFYLARLLNDTAKPLFDGGALAQVAARAQSAGVTATEAARQLAREGVFLPAQTRRLDQIDSSLREISTNGQVADIVEQRARRLFPNPDEAQAERLRQLAARAAPFGAKMRDFLETIALQREADLYDPRADRVTLMTLHAAKGLEFPVVFIVGCEEDLLPYRMPGKTFDLEEERRLFYVGMTRAQERLVLLHAGRRLLFGEMRQNPPSPFLGDIEPALKEFRDLATDRAAKKEANLPTQLSLF